ncbi:hypothetical protein DINM_003078 [Dirofilaria immitis]|nr:hypothetical protein [Dirofilaria immitis]
MESNSANNDVRKMIDTLVAGYLGRQKYWESLKCLVNESSILHAAQCGGMSIILGDTVHGKHLEEIIILFSEYGNFGLNPGLLDFGVRLRALANEFTSLTNASAHWSDAQKLLYGKHSAPSRSCSQQCLSVSTGELNICGTNRNVLPAVNVDSTTSISSQHSSGSASARRKCTQPVSINTRRREFMKEVVEPVVHTAQQIIDNGNCNTTDPNSSLSALSMITIDESAVGTLDRCMAHENFAELIESIEKDFPDGFFDSFPNSDNTESFHEAVFEAVSSQSNDVQQEHLKEVDSQNLYNIPHSATIGESKPLCSSTPTKLKTQEKSSAMSETSVVAESAIFKDRVEVECPYLPIEGTEKEEIDAVGRDLFFLRSPLTILLIRRKPERWKYLQKIRNELCTPVSVNNNADVISHQMEKCIEDKGIVKNTKCISKSSIEREIELLFENSDDQGCGNLGIQKGDGWKNSNSIRNTPSIENRKESEYRDEISGDENLTVGCSERPAEQFKKQEKFKRLEEDRMEARANAEKRKKEKEMLMKKEREEIERQKREVEEKELKRAAERERKRREAEEREAREKEQREKRRKEREDHRLFGDDDDLKPVTKISDKEEIKESLKKAARDFHLKEDCHAKKEKSERSTDIKTTKNAKASIVLNREINIHEQMIVRNSKMESGLNRLDTLDDLFNCLATKPGTSRKDETDVMETKSYKKVVSGVNKGRENLLVGVDIQPEATRIRTKYEHEEKLKQEYRKVEGMRRGTNSSSEYNTRKRILDLPIPKTDLLSQLLKPNTSLHNDSLRRTVSAKNISNCSDSNTLISASSKVPVLASKSTTAISPSFPGTSESKLLHCNESSDIGSSSIQAKKPRLDMAAIDAVLQSLHGLDKASSSSSPSFSAASASGSEPTLI